MKILTVIFLSITLISCNKETKEYKCVCDNTYYLIKTNDVKTSEKICYNTYSNGKKLNCKIE
jgi:hypothetical protein